MVQRFRSIVLIVFGIIAILLSSCSGNKKDVTHLNYTDVFYIDGNVCGAYNEDDLNTMLRYINRNDKVSFDLMRRDGRLLDLYDGTEIKIIDLGTFNSKVRTNDNKEFWVSNEFIKSVHLGPSPAQYHNDISGEVQTQYSGSTEQKNDLDAIDEYAKNHPEF